MQSMIEIARIIVITIINKNLLILFIFSGSENFAIEFENHKLDYLQDSQTNKDPTSINQTSLWPNNLAQSADNFVMSIKKRNLVNKFEKNCVVEFNLSSQKPSSW